MYLIINILGIAVFLVIAVLFSKKRREIAYRDFPKALIGKYQNYTQADRTDRKSVV